MLFSIKLPKILRLASYIKVNDKLIGCEYRSSYGGVLTLTKIGYNEDKDTAVIGVESDWGEDYLILEKGTSWIIQYSYPMKIWDWHPHPWLGEEF
jgi:hypothetical protein